MYNKIFTKILDSSIWLEPDGTRLVWLTFLAAMDEDGFAAFAAVANLAHRARVSLPACSEAVKCLEGPDENSSDPEFGGRRIERVEGGWQILNSSKYRDLVTRAIARERTRERVRRFRERLSSNGHVTPSNVSVTPSEANSYSEARSDHRQDALIPDLDQDRDQASNQHAHQREQHALRRTQMAAMFADFWKQYPRKVGKDKARRAFMKLDPNWGLVSKFEAALAWQRNQPQWTKDKGRFCPHAATWLNQKRYDDEPFEPLNGGMDATDAAFERLKGKLNGQR